ncbi:MAG TPA: hypothetical protein VN957_23150, partial [Chthoniobacterales bacterium]|nr:hypothetical protein [Chthoniobacterales bacterium]
CSLCSPEIGREMSALPSRDGFRSWLRLKEAGSPMHQAESSSSLSCLSTGLRFRLLSTPSLDDAVAFSYGQTSAFCPMRTFTPLLVRTFRRTSSAAVPASYDVLDVVGKERLRLLRHSAVLAAMTCPFADKLSEWLADQAA